MSKLTPKEYVDIMLKNDRFSRWLGLEIMEIRDGYCQLKMAIKKPMLNGFGIVHGGIIFSMADSAFAFASNGGGRISVALDVSISFTKSGVEGDLLFVIAKEEYSGYKTGLYTVRIENEQGELIALFKGNVYRTSKTLDQS